MVTAAGWGSQACGKAGGRGASGPLGTTSAFPLGEDVALPECDWMSTDTALR